MHSPHRLNVFSVGAMRLNHFCQANGVYELCEHHQQLFRGHCGSPMLVVRILIVSDYPSPVHRLKGSSDQETVFRALMGIWSL